jgi:hypothetical protein
MKPRRAACQARSTCLVAERIPGERRGARELEAAILPASGALVRAP